MTLVKVTEGVRRVRNLPVCRGRRGKGREGGRPPAHDRGRSQGDVSPVQGTRAREYADKRVDEGGILHKGGVIFDESGVIVRVSMHAPALTDDIGFFGRVD